MPVYISSAPVVISQPFRYVEADTPFEVPEGFKPWPGWRLASEPAPPPRPAPKHVPGAAPIAQNKRT